MEQRLDAIEQFLVQGGVVIWLITALAVLALALILWKVWRLLLLGAWSGRQARRATELWAEGEGRAAREVLGTRRSIRSRFARTAIDVRETGSFEPGEQREELVRVAKGLLADARAGLRPLELIATIAPLLGLLGTVLGMIAAFQALQEAGARADPATLAGGIWEALLTTAAGMAVAIPASMALSWFESVADKIQRDLEDIGTRILTRGCEATELPRAA